MQRTVAPERLRPLLVTTYWLLYSDALVKFITMWCHWLRTKFLEAEPHEVHLELAHGRPEPRHDDTLSRRDLRPHVDASRRLHALPQHE